MATRDFISTPSDETKIIYGMWARQQEIQKNADLFDKIRGTRDKIENEPTPQEEDISLEEIIKKI